MNPVSIVIPAFNEEKAIGPVVDALKALPLDAEVIIVDDGSTDATAAIAERHGARVVRRPHNSGYGRSVKDGVRHATRDVIVVSDADGTYPIDRIPSLLQEFERGFDMVVGARQGPAYRGSPLKSLARLFLKSIVEFTTGERIPDVNSGMRIFRKSAATPYFPDICEGFSFTTTITLVYHLTHKTVSYVSIPYEKRIGHSKVKMFHDTLRTLQYITECIVRYNPLKIFLLLAILTLFWGFVHAFFLGWATFFFAVCAAAVVVSLGLIAESMRKPRG